MGGTFYSKRYDPNTKRNRKTRPKTFKTAQAAEKWAQEQKLTKYSVKEKVLAIKGNKFFVESN
mgnify:CR=1 FL=1|jgi:hypothetical protein